MDKKLKFTQEVYENVVAGYNNIIGLCPGISFEIWTDIPQNFRCSYFVNEQLINPVKNKFNEWEVGLLKRPSPIYSIALYNNCVTSSIYGSKSTYEYMMNFWVTNPAFRGQRIGRGVLLNLIKYFFEEDNTFLIRAWDITTQQVDIELTNIGFTT